MGGLTPNTIFHAENVQFIIRKIWLQRDQFWKNLPQPLDHGIFHVELHSGVTTRDVVLPFVFFVKCLTFFADVLNSASRASPNKPW